jgi:RNA polymerase primary sigma factor
MTDDAMASGDDALLPALSRTLRRAVPTREEEQRLARRAAAGDVAARNLLVEGSARLVVAIARDHRGRGVPFADLVQEGMLGLLEAVKRFDPDRGVRLATYAVWWIRRAMLRTIVAAPTIPLPPEAARELATIRRAESGRGPRPDAATLSRTTGLPRRRIDLLRASPHVVTSLDAVPNESAPSLTESIADPAVPAMASAMERELERNALHRALAVLPPRTGRVIELRYGLGGGEPLSHEQIGRTLGVGAPRSRQLEREGLRRLHALAVASALDP